MSVAIDRVGPSVISNIPLSGASGVSTATAVSATFSEDVDTNTIDISSFELTDGGAPVAVGFTYDETSKTATLNPSSSLDYGTVYTATVKTTVTDLAGNNMVSVHQWMFTTEAAPDTFAPDTPYIVGFTEVIGASATNSLDWLAVTDDVGVIGYKIFNGVGAQIATATVTNHSFPGLALETTYSYYIKAYDAAGNVSGASNTLSLRPSATPEATPGDTSTVTPISITVLPEITVTYSDTDCEGTTTITKQLVTVTPPSGIKFLEDEYEIDHVPGCYDAPIRVAVEYDPADIAGNESLLKMYHDEAPKDGIQDDVTIYVDTENNVIVGEINSLSPVNLGVPAAPSPATGVNSHVLLILSLLLVVIGGLLLLPRTKEAVDKFPGRW